MFYETPPNIWLQATPDCASQRAVHQWPRLAALIVGRMEAEPPVKWKSDCLRLGLAPLKAYVIGIPLIVVIWRANFSEPNPHGWDERAVNTYLWVLADIFGRVEYGYLVCTAGLALALVIGCWIRDVKAVRAVLGYGMVALLCFFWSYLLSHPPHTR